MMFKSRSNSHTNRYGISGMKGHVRLRFLSALLSLSLVISAFSPASAFASGNPGPGTGAVSVSESGSAAYLNGVYSGVLHKYNGETVSNPASVRDLFDADYYLALYPELKAALSLTGGSVGSDDVRQPLTAEDREKLLRHFLASGLTEGRKACPYLDVAAYRHANSDLEAAFGGSWDSYVRHYFALGIGEGRSSGSTDTDLVIQNLLNSLPAGQSAEYLARPEWQNLSAGVLQNAFSRLLQMYPNAILSGRNLMVPAYGDNLAQWLADVEAHTSEDNDPGSGYYPSQNNMPQPPDEKKEKAKPINHLAREQVNGYVLYTNLDGTGPQRIDNGTFDGYFYPEVYRSILNNPELTSDQRKYTVMIYLCGTDLEDKGAGASKDLVNVLKSEYDINKVNVLVLAGGTRSWAPKCMQELNNNVNFCLYYMDPAGVEKGTGSVTQDQSKKWDYSNMDNILTDDSEDNGNGSMRLLANFGQADMGDSEMLLGFMDFAYDLFPADDYWLSLWNHGGGSDDGICFSDEVSAIKNSDIYNGNMISGKGLTIGRIEEALYSSKLYNEHGGLSILSMEACLMAGIETAYNISPYVDYMIASEEVTDGRTAYDQYFAVINKYFEEPTTEELAVMASASYLTEHGDVKYYLPSTTACFNLKELAGYGEKVDRFGNAMSALLGDRTTAGSAFRAVESAAGRSVHFGYDTSADVRDYLDMSDFLSKLRVFLFDGRDQAEAANDTASRQKYDEALQAIDDLYNDKFIEYRSAKYNRNFVYAETAIGRSRMGLGMENTQFEEQNNPWNDYGYGLLSGITMMFPYYSSYHENYMEEAIFPGYTGFLEKYMTIAASVAEQNRIRQAAADLKEKYQGIISDITVERYSWDTTVFNQDGETQKDVRNTDLLIRINFNTENGSDSAAGMDPVNAFMKTTEKVSLMSTRYDTAWDKATGEEKSIDLVIGTSKDSMRPGMFVGGDIGFGKDSKGETVLIDHTGLTIDASLFDVIAIFVRGYTSAEHTEESYKMDWGTVMDEVSAAQIDYSPFGKDHEGNAYTEDSVIVLDGSLSFKDEEGNDKTVDAGLVFGKTADSGDALAYLGAAGGESGAYTYYKPDEKITIGLYHNILEDGKIIRAEDKYNLNAPQYVTDPGFVPYISQEYLTYIAEQTVGKEEPSDDAGQNPIDNRDFEQLVIKAVQTDGEEYLITDERLKVNSDEYEKNGSRIGTAADVEERKPKAEGSASDETDDGRNHSGSDRDTRSVRADEAVGNDAHSTEIKVGAETETGTEAGTETETESSGDVITASAEDPEKAAAESSSEPAGTENENPAADSSPEEAAAATSDPVEQDSENKSEDPEKQDPEDENKDQENRKDTETTPAEMPAENAETSGLD